ncbi:MAG TPA: immunity 17 family protein [Spirochaetales bacterium]|nr:immunity 17 family protein [Spirochaetales bacterium]
MDFGAILIILAGAFTVICAIGNWDWFMDSRKARFFTTLLTRNGARIMYGVIGLGLVTVGVLMLAGVIQ